MKRIRITLLVHLVLAVSIFLSGCPSPLVTYRYPGAQPNTVWATEDGTVVFYVDADDIFPMYGYIKDGDELVEIAVCMSDLTTMVDIYYAEDWENYDEKHPKSFALGPGTVVSKKEYRIEITRADAFFEKGQILTFYRSDNKIGTHDRGPGGQGTVCVIPNEQ